MSCRASRLKIILALALLLLCPLAHALTNGVALLPPMGFNSFYSYGPTVNEALIKSIADVMATNGMLAAGYNYMNLDDGWAGLRDTNGVMVADTNKFPNGMKSLVDYLHAEGFKVGIYTTASSNTCANFPGSANHVVQDINTYAAWGIDYLKYEGCHVPTFEIYPRGQIYCARVKQALAQCGRPMVFSFSIGGAFENWMPQYINLWRGTGDINSGWNTILSHIDFVAQTPAAAGPGGWNDPDVLEIGSGFFSETEYTSIFSMWCMLSAPLLTLSTETTHTNIMCNADAIAVDQDPACIQGVCVSSNNNLQVWRKPLGSSNSSTLAVALFNRGGIATNITANWSDLGLTPGVGAVWDMWAHAYAGNFTNSYTATIAPHGIQLLKFINGTTLPLPPAGTNYVSDLPWLADVTNVQVFPNNAPYNRDLSGAGPPISLRGVTYTKGVGMNGFTRARYFLGGTATRFQSDIGADDAAGNFGSVIFRVYADGTKIYDSGALTTHNAAQSIDLDLTGYQSVTLEATNGLPGNADDFADWADARITFAALPPNTPGGLSATATANQITLSWYAVSGATNYYLQRATTPGGTYVTIATNASPGYTDTNVAPGFTYLYKISAANANGSSTNSLEIGAALPDYWSDTQTGTAQSWNINGNWTNAAAFPNGLGALAVISPAIVSNQTINLNQGITLGSLILGVTNGSAAINLAANGGTLTFDDDTASAFLTELATAAGDTVSVPLALNHNLAITSQSTNWLTLAGPISGSGSLTANGPGPLLLNGSNSFTGPVSIQAGLLKIGNAAALGATNGSLNIGTTATLDANGFGIGAKTVTVSGAGFDGNGALISDAAAPQTNAFQFVTLAGDTVLGGAARWDIRGASNLAPSGILSTGGNAFALTKTGRNQISLASLTVDSALGDININDGTLSFENATTSMGDPAHSLKIQSGATLAFNQTTTTWNKMFALDGDGITPTVTSSNGANIMAGPITMSGTCLINVAGGSLSLNGPLSGNANLVKDSTGTLSIGGTNNGSFAANIVVNAGTLAIQNPGAIIACPQINVVQGAVLDVTALNSGLTLAPGQTLSGGGVVNGNLTVGNQAMLEPDSSFGVPTFEGSLTFSPGSACSLEVIGFPPFMSEQVRVLGNVSFAGTLIVSSLAGTLAAGDSFKLFNAASYTGTFGNILPPIPGTNIIWDASQLAVNGTLRVVTGTLTRFTTFGNQGGKVVFGGVGGKANSLYYLLTAANPALPASQWTRIATNFFDAQGAFSITNTPGTNTHAVFFRIQVPGS